MIGQYSNVGVMDVLQQNSKMEEQITADPKESRIAAEALANDDEIEVVFRNLFIQEEEVRESTEDVVEETPPLQQREDPLPIEETHTVEAHEAEKAVSDEKVSRIGARVKTNFLKRALLPLRFRSAGKGAETTKPFKMIGRRRNKKEDTAITRAPTGGHEEEIFQQKEDAAEDQKEEDTDDFDLVPTIISIETQPNPEEVATTKQKILISNASSGEQAAVAEQDGLISKASLGERLRSLDSHLEKIAAEDDSHPDSSSDSSSNHGILDDDEDDDDDEAFIKIVQTLDTDMSAFDTIPPKEISPFERLVTMNQSDESFSKDSLENFSPESWFSNEAIKEDGDDEDDDETDKSSSNGESEVILNMYQIGASRTASSLDLQSFGNKFSNIRGTFSLASGVESETLDEGTLDEGTYGEGTLDERTLDEGTMGDGTLDEETLDEGTSDEGTYEQTTFDEGTYDEGTSDEGNTLSDGDGSLTDDGQNDQSDGGSESSSHTDRPSLSDNPTDEEYDIFKNITSSFFGSGETDTDVSVDVYRKSNGHSIIII